MSSTKPNQNNDHDPQQNKGWVTVKSNTTQSPNKRKRRRKRNKNKTTTPKPIATKKKHAAPANAATIYCQWFQEGLCHRGKNCFFIHELDPLSEKNPIQHRQMLKQLISPKKASSNSTIQIPLQKPTKPIKIINNNDNDDGFILPSQNIAFQQTINKNNKYNRYNDFTPNYNSPINPPNPYATTTATAYNSNTFTNNINMNDSNQSLNANAMEFIPTQPHVQPQQPPVNYNPYLTAENAHTLNPYELSSDFVHKSVDKSPNKLNVNDSILNNPQQLNEDDYEVWEDENGEIIVIEKDQLYGDDPYYHDQKMLKEFNKLRLNNTNANQKGIRGGGNTYNYGGNVIYDNNDSKQSDSTSKNMNIKSSKHIKSQLNGYSNVAAKFNGIYPSQGRVESFAADDNGNPDYDPNAKICRFWLNGTCAYNERCNMAHRFESNSCPHCDKCIGKSPLIQQQHLIQCASKLLLDEEMKMSESIECGICRENILLKGSKFGLLTGCTHTFCLKCIREWRGVINQSKEVVRACPICRQVTWFIVPCDRFIFDKKRKEDIINKYKKRLSEIRCKHFDEDEECPFGTSCFYKHVRKDGTVDDKKLTLRHMINADGETEIMKQVRLSEFLFGND